jgi:hypothetical protein
MLRPVYDPILRTLSFGETCVHTYGAQAWAEIIVLEKFQEEHWPTSLANPAGMIANAKYGEWLKTTACRLNKSQETWLLEFHSQPKDHVIGWKPRLP